MKRLWTIIRLAVKSAYRDRIFADAGALAFFALLALAPFSFFMRWIADVAGENAQAAIMGQAEAVVTMQSHAVLKLLASHTHTSLFQGPFAPFLSLFVVLVSSMIVFAHIHIVLNKIWQVAPKKRTRWWGFLRKQLIPLAMLLFVGGLLLLSIVTSAIFAILAKSIDLHWKTLQIVSAFMLAVLAFTLLYKWFPDTIVKWRHAVLGGLAASVFFEFGKFGLEKYLAISGILSWYGSAGPLVALLMWVYYSSVIIFFGAEITQKCPRHDI